MKGQEMAVKTKIDNGGPAFPSQTNDFGEMISGGMTLRQWFATHAPEPSSEEVQHEMQRDINLNPYNDYHKPPRRGKLQIIAELKYAYADAMIAAGKAEGRS